LLQQNLEDALSFGQVTANKTGRVFLGHSVEAKLDGDGVGLEMRSVGMGADAGL